VLKDITDGFLRVLVMAQGYNGASRAVGVYIAIVVHKTRWGDGLVCDWFSVPVFSGGVRDF
jgi:hypothetical protein